MKANLNIRIESQPNSRMLAVSYSTSPLVTRIIYVTRSTLKIEIARICEDVVRKQEYLDSEPAHQDATLEVWG